MIPKIIHQIWIGEKILPNKFFYFQEKWKQIYNDYKFIYWNDSLLREKNMIDHSIEQYYIADIKIAMKVDLLRFKILKEFGGIYIDVDNEPLKKMPDENLKYNFFAGYQSNQEINIAVLGSQINEKLVNEYYHKMIDNIQKFTTNNIISNEIWKITGPEFFTKHVESYILDEKYKIFDCNYFYPYSWNEKERRNENFIKTSPESYSVHHWEHSWK